MQSNDESSAFWIVLLAVIGMILVMGIDWLDRNNAAQLNSIGHYLKSDDAEPISDAARWWLRRQEEAE